MIAHRTLRYHCLAALGLAALLWAAPAVGEDIPAFQYAFGTPAIEPVWSDDYHDPHRYPSLAVDESYVYVGGAQLNVFTRDGEWVDFWPMASDIALAAPDRVCVLDAPYGAVHVYTREGEFLTGWGGYGDTADTFSAPAAIAADESSVYVLDTYPGRAVRFDLEGNFLNAWDTPVLPEPYLNSPIDIASDPAGGVWVLNESKYFSEAEQEWTRDARCYKYAPDGSEEASWPLADASGWFAIGADPAGNVWVLDDGGGYPRKLRRFTPGGELLVAFSAPQGSGYTHNFAISPDSQLVALNPQQIAGAGWDTRGEILCPVVSLDFEGQPLGSFGDQWQMPDVGALLLPYPFAVDAAGATACRAHPPGYRYTLPDYVVRYGPGGELVEVVETEKWPIYNPASDTVELVEAPWQPNFIDGTGAYWIYSGEWLDWPPDDIGVLDLVVESATTQETLSIVLPSAEAPEPSGNCCCRDVAVRQAHDGNILLAVWEVVDDYETGTTMFVLTVTRDGTVLSSATIEQATFDWYPECVEQDDAGNIYIGNWNGVWKFSASGEFIGRIGGWGGEGDQRDAPGSLVLGARAIDIDATGRLRVLDYEANRILLFAYTPGPFPDVSYSHWAKEAIAAAVDAGIVCGYGDGIYGPGLPVSRDQMAVYVSRALVGGDANVPEFTGTTSFSDVGEEHWALDYVEYAFSQNVVTGYEDGLYHPEYEVTRDQMAVYVARALVAPTGEAALADHVPAEPRNFPDVPSDHWAYTHIEYCVENGVVAGYLDGYYHPEIVVTRDQMAVYVARAFGLTS
jgi:hypothetical protein